VQQRQQRKAAKAAEGVSQQVAANIKRSRSNTISATPR
jgi:hypothetical protein